MADLAEKIAALLPRAEGNPAAMMQIALMMRQDGQCELALAQCRKALALAPQNAELLAQANQLLSVDVPAWHFNIVHDARRNAAYDAALRRAIQRDSRVLEIGTGTSLLAMMAARAGAAEVITCEKTPAIAEAAREIVAQNGFSDRVRVIGKHSDDLDVEGDLHGPVDVLVSEIMSNNLLSQDVLTTYERAARNLLKPGARVIPARGSIRVALAEDTRDDSERLELIDGFDLSPFNSLLAPVRQIRVGDERLELRSEAADLFVFDFGAHKCCPPARASVSCVATGGRVNGIVQWIAVDMDEVTRYENRPAHGTKSCWAALFHPLSHAIDTSSRQIVPVFGLHDRHQVLIWCDVNRDAIRQNSG